MKQFYIKHCLKGAAGQWGVGWAAANACSAYFSDKSWSDSQEIFLPEAELPTGLLLS